jgi:DnaJ family protein C protein 9
VVEDDSDFNWHDFYRAMFDEVVSEENMKRVAVDYKGSAEERRDLRNAYTRFNGNLESIYNAVMLSDILEDDERFRSILDEEIERGNIQSLPAYERANNDAARDKAKAAERKRRDDFDKRHGTDAVEKTKAKQGRKKKEPSSMGDLAAMILSRQKNRENVMENIAAKYSSKPGSKKRGSVFDDMPSEDAFQATREKLNKRAKKDTDAGAEEDGEDIEESGEDTMESDESEDERPKPKRKGRLTRGRGRGRAKAKA